MKQKNNRPLLVSITGDICSGKSTALRFCKKAGIPVISADDVTTQLHEDPAITSEICRLLKIPAYDKSIVRDLIFGDAKKKALLEGYLHPKILRELQTEIDSYKGKGEQYRAVFVEIPLLFECNLEDCFDLNLLMIADDKIKMIRQVDRYGGDAEQAKQRQNAQMPQKIKMKKADVVVRNDDSFAVLFGQLTVVLQMLPFIKQREIRRLVNG